MKYIFLIFILSITITKSLCYIKAAVPEWVEIPKCYKAECMEKCRKKDMDGICAQKKLNLRIETYRLYCKCIDKRF
uniref:Uncharacterized protein n=1 Tax=Strongyloides stercoralis TaxID=6248 RepID=A0A0K0E4F9_STRER